MRRVVGCIDQSNCHRQATLKLERKFKTHDWSDRVNHSIFGMSIVDTWLVYSQCTQTEEEDQGAFYEYLAAEMTYWSRLEGQETQYHGLLQINARGFVDCKIWGFGRNVYFCRGLAPKIQVQTGNQVL
jgi:hypothetical protein